MTGRFRAINKISKHKMSLLWGRAFAVLTKEWSMLLIKGLVKRANK